MAHASDSPRPLLRTAGVALVAAIATSGVISVSPAAAQDSVDLPALRPAVQHDGAPAPQPFGPEDYVGYISDVSSYSWGIYYDVVDGFNDLRAGHPELMGENLDKTVAINNEASPETVARAQQDAIAAEGGLLSSLSDAFGAELSEPLRTALAEGRLPKTQMLLDSGYLSRAGLLSSSTLAEKVMFNYDRPFVVAPERIAKHNNGESDFYELGGSKSFPSGHTNQATWVTTLLAAMLPELAPQLLARGAEAGYNRIVLGVHYPLDVMGGRMAGIAAAADRWNDPKMRDALMQAGDELRAELEWRTGRPLAETAAQQDPYRDTSEAVAEYTDRMHYDFPRLHAPDAPMIVPRAAPDLLVTAFPDLDYGQRAEVLRQTALPAGYPLDNQGAAGSWQRLNLAAALSADVEIDEGGTVAVR